MVLTRLIKPLLLMFFAFLLITACQSVTQKTDTSTEQIAIASECRVIRHRLGETCIPLKPQRIVALDIPAILDSLLTLDIKPLGTVVDEHGEGRYFPAVLPDKIAGIETVGTASSPSLEKILALHPDLILLPDYTAQNYEQLSKIAPTVLIDIYSVKAPIKKVFQYIARLVHQEEKAEEVLNQYDQRIHKFQELLGDRLKGAEYSVISHFLAQFWVPPIHESYFQVFRDLGLQIKPIFLKQNEWFTASVEVINQYDADFLFLIEDVTGSSSFLSRNPLVASLEAVKNGQAYIVDPKIWTFYGPIGMNLLLDDLSKYLLEGKQDPYFQKND